MKLSRASFFVPLGIFVAIVAIGYAGFHLGDRKVLPSPLIGKPFPDFTAALLHDPSEQRSRDALLGRPVLVNVWATWCPTCKAEHEMLLRIQQESNLEIVGVNYKDNRGEALRWLALYGDPYSFNLFDGDGQIGIELGVYGAPETFLLNPDGQIVYKLVGEVNERIWTQEIQPRLQEML